MKIAYSNLQFELTRRCNQSCLHCCRGDSQDTDLSNEVIDAFFDNNEIFSISDLSFSGGEPTLNASALDYIVNRIIKKNIPVRRFVLSINGLLYSDILVNALNKLNQHCKRFSKTELKSYGFLFISQSQYHQKYDDSVIQQYLNLPYFIKPKKEIIDSSQLLPFGNALKNKLTNNLPDFLEIMDFNRNIKLTTYNNEIFLVLNYQYITSNGNVLNSEALSYEMMDKFSIGNVLIKPIWEMYREQEKFLDYKDKILH